jgi:hypothetical protein
MLQRPLTTSAGDLAPHQRLAVAVSRQAILDEQTRARQLARGQVRTSCTIGAWLRHDESLRVWCSVAGLDPELVFTRIDRLSA